jgi:hypothetical protein
MGASVRYRTIGKEGGAMTLTFVWLNGIFDPPLINSTV